MSDEEVMDVNGTDTDAAVLRIYEIGYIIVPSAKEEDIEKIVATIRSEIEKAGGSFVAEGAPSLTRLAYPIEVREGGRKTEHDRGYFGWIKFEVETTAVRSLDNALKHDPHVMRFILFQTVREDTRAKMKPPTLREVKRTDIIKSTPRRIEESSVPVSEEELEKAIQHITAE